MLLEPHTLTAKFCSIINMLVLLLCQSQPQASSGLSVDGTSGLW